MCHNITTKSIHCDNVTHSEWYKTECKKMWFEPWYRVLGCKTQKDWLIEVAEECQTCKDLGPEAKVEPWETVESIEVWPLDGDTDSARDSSPEPTWDATESDDEDDELIDEDTEMSFEDWWGSADKDKKEPSSDMTSPPSRSSLG